MRYLYTLIILFFSLTLVIPSSSNAANKPNPDEFKGNNGYLEENELIQFFLAYYKISYYDVYQISPSTSFIEEQQGDVRKAKEKTAVNSYLIEFTDKFSEPYTPGEVQAYVDHEQVPDLTGETSDEENSWDLFKPYQKKGSNWRFGQIRFRQKVEDWNKDTKDVDGVSVSYSENRLKENKTWSTAGSVSYPIEFFSEYKGAKKESTQKYNYSNKAFIPAIKWKYFDLNDDETKDLEELTFLGSFHFSNSLKLQPTGDINSLRNEDITTWRNDFYISPFYSTDFDFDGELIGVNLTYEPIIQKGEFFHTGSWHKLSHSIPTAYLFRVIPGAIYSHVSSEGPFINRDKNDDSFGLTASLELGLKPFGNEKTGWEFKTVYDLFYDFTGEDDGYFERWGIKVSYWFIEKTGLTLDYSDGDHFLTKDQVDLLTLGLQVRL